jgi:hypothetical protein
MQLINNYIKLIKYAEKSLRVRNEVLRVKFGLKKSLSNYNYKQI